MNEEEHYFSKLFIFCILLSMSVILIGLTLGVQNGYNCSVEEANETLNQINQERQNITVTSIFLNNYLLTLIVFVPFIGIFWEFLLQFNTGYVLGNVAKAYNLNQFIFLSEVLSSPVGLIEYASYFLVLAESLCLMCSLFLHEFKPRLFNHSWKTFLVVTVLLFIGAIVECYMINGNIIF